MVGISPRIVHRTGEDGNVVGKSIWENCILTKGQLGIRNELDKYEAFAWIIRTLNTLVIFFALIFTSLQMD
jgi:hypothetical protein